jgi:hypothetical protein
MLLSEAIAMTYAIVSTAALIALLATGCTVTQLEERARSETELSQADAARGDYGASATELEKAAHLKERAEKKAQEHGQAPPSP